MTEEIEISDQIEPRPYSKLIDERRMGVFDISRDLLTDSDDEFNLKLFGNFIIVRAEYLFTKDTIEYTAYSPLFEPVSPACMPPRYLIQIDGDGNHSAIKG